MFEKSRSRATTWLLGAALLALVGALVVIGVEIEPPSTGEVQGTLTVTAGPIGDLTFEPSECFGAERIAGIRFEGVALLGPQPDTKMIRVVRHTKHPGATVRRDSGQDVVVATRASPGQPWQELTLTPQNCPGLRIEIVRFEPQPDHDSHTDRYRGRLEADCSLEQGGRVSMAISFDNCRCNRHMAKRSVR